MTVLAVSRALVRSKRPLLREAGFFPMLLLEVIMSRLNMLVFGCRECVEGGEVEGEIQ